MSDELVEAYTETAKAVSATAETVGKVVDSAAAIVRAPLIQALVGLAGGNWAIEANERQRARLKGRTEEILNARGIVDPIALSPSLAVPLIAAAEIETRDELQEMWAQLLANGMTPGRSERVRLRFIETLKQLEPLDSLVLVGRRDKPNELTPNPLQFFADAYSKPRDQVLVSVENLIRLGCAVESIGGINGFLITAYGRLFLEACSA